MFELGKWVHNHTANFRAFHPPRDDTFSDPLTPWWEFRTVQAAPCAASDGLRSISLSQEISSCRTNTISSVTRQFLSALSAKNMVALVRDTGEPFDSRTKVPTSHGAIAPLRDGREEARRQARSRHRPQRLQPKLSLCLLHPMIPRPRQQTWCAVMPSRSCDDTLPWGVWMKNCHRR